jgi:hypothetical protein
LALGKMAAQNAEYRPRRQARVDRPDLAEVAQDAVAEFVERTVALWLGGRPPFLIVDPTHENRQLGAEMGGELEWNAVADGAEHGAEFVPSDAPIRPGDSHDLV